MARSKTDELAARVAELEKRRAAQEAERAKLEAAPTMDAEIAEARAALETAQAEAGRAAAEALRPKERRQIEAIVKQAAALKAAIDELSETHKEIAAQHGTPRARLPFQIYQVLEYAETVWRMYGDGFTPGTLSKPRQADPPSRTDPEKRRGRLVTVGE